MVHVRGFGRSTAPGGATGPLGGRRHGLRGRPARRCVFSRPLTFANPLIRTLAARTPNAGTGRTSVTRQCVSGTWKSAGLEPAQPQPAWRPGEWASPSVLNVGPSPGPGHQIIARVLALRPAADPCRYTELPPTPHRTQHPPFRRPVRGEHPHDIRCHHYEPLPRPLAAPLGIPHQLGSRGPVPCAA